MGNKALKSVQAGVSTYVLIVFLPLVIIAGYLGAKVIPFYYDYYELTNQMQSLARVASVHTDQELRQKLAAHLKRTNLPIDIEAIIIERFGQSIRMQTEYQEILYVTWQGTDYTLHTFDFEINVVENLQ